MISSLVVLKTCQKDAVKRLQDCRQKCTEYANFFLVKVQEGLGIVYNMITQEPLKQNLLLIGTFFCLILIEFVS